MSNVTAQLTDEEVLGLRAALATFDSRAERAQLERRAREIEEAERRAAHEREIAESEARAARDPVSIAARAEAARNAQSEREAELAKLRLEAKLDVGAEIEAMRLIGHRSHLNPCRDCGLKPFQVKQVGMTHTTYCLACHAKRRLRCDVCGRHDDKSIPTSWCPADGQFRCPRCLEELAAEVPLKPAFLVPGR